MRCQNFFCADHYKHVKTTILGPRIMLELVSHLWLTRHHGCNRGYLGAFNAWVWGAETFNVWSLQTRQNNYFISQNHVITRVGPFAWRNITVAIGGIWVHLMHVFGVPKHFRADRNERVQTNILGPRIMLELASHHLVDAPSQLQYGVSGCI